MKLSAEKLAGMVLTRSEHADISNLGLDLQLSNIFWALDGTRTVEVIARQDHYDMADLAEKINLLMNKGLVNNPLGEETVSQQYMDTLKEHLTRIVGPVAHIMIENAISELGHNALAFPARQANRLIELLARKIQPEAKANEFKSAMLKQ